MFIELKTLVVSQFEKLKALGNIYTVDPDRTEIWETYLNAIPEDKRQSNNCNCCKSFIRQFGGVVSIDPDTNKVLTLWDFEFDNTEYGPAVKALRKYVAKLPVKDRFFHFENNMGTDKNVDKVKNVVWNHFHLKTPKTNMLKKDDIPSSLAKHRDQSTLLHRAFKELKLEAVDTVLELIGQNSLYRGNEFKGAVEKFRIALKKSQDIPTKLLANYCWIQSTILGPAICGIRNSAIGTLLVNLSEEMDLDTAVGAFERMVAPTNYKRPTSLVTPKMVDAAKARLEELGLVGALKRRQLDSRDLTADNALYVYRPVKKSDDIFEELKSNNPIHPKSLKKVEEISLSDFLEKVVPTAKNIRLLLENRHTSNLVTLVGPVEEGPTLFKWNNNFSWSYTGEVADSVKERVKEAGGNVEGKLRISLSWNNYDDLDLHLHEPSGYRINYTNKRMLSRAGGVLDVDMNAGSGSTRTPVENIIYKNVPSQDGDYVIVVNNFSKRESIDNTYEVEIEIDGEIHTFTGTNPASGNSVTVATVKVQGTSISVVGSNGGKLGSYPSKEAWNLKTGIFQQVNAITLSPNHWDTKTGNKHVFFLLHNCKTDQKVRGFYNEFLKEELTADRKVFEILGSKISVESRENELSGVGFSDTIRNDFFVEVEGTFKRTLKVKV
jgi:hypothetical protein